MESALNNPTNQAPSLASRAYEAFKVLLIVLVILTVSPRFSALLFLVIYLLIAAFSRSARRFGVASTNVVGFLVLSILPVDISFRTAPGRPHFARVINSFSDPTFGFRADQQGALERLHRGEFVDLSDC